uniref:Alternative protein SSH2 n=1 Tax=Homo sapiens TaxID=9606 RepID=L8E929_HUMAN|nr:alternative protein SSH2 [Homo sapiens]
MHQKNLQWMRNSQRQFQNWSAQTSSCSLTRKMQFQSKKLSLKLSPSVKELGRFN